MYDAAMVVGRRDIGWRGVSVVSVVREDGFFDGVVVIIGAGEDGDEEDCERVVGRFVGVEGAEGRDIVGRRSWQRKKVNGMFQNPTRLAREVLACLIGVSDVPTESA